MKLALEGALLLHFNIDLFDTWWVVYLSRIVLVNARACKQHDAWRVMFYFLDVWQGQVKQGVKNDWAYSKGREKKLPCALVCSMQCFWRLSEGHSMFCIKCKMRASSSASASLECVCVCVYLPVCIPTQWFSTKIHWKSPHKEKKDDELFVR